jgi:hypothetical protein
MRELEIKNKKLRVQSAIRDFSEEKLRMMGLAWSINDAEKMNVLLLQEELESKVFSMEEKKRKEPLNLMLKGIDDFLAEIKNDDSVRPKAVIQMAIRDKLLEYKPTDSHYYFEGENVCFVPTNKVDTREDFVLNFLRDEKHKDMWVSILKKVVTTEYIETLDKYGVRWLCGQLGIPLNQQEPELRKALLAEFVSAE